MEWRIYYGDGSTYDSTQGSPRDAPGTNVQVIAQANATVGRLILGGDYYYNHEGEWLALDLFGLLDHLIAAGIVKAGRTLPAEQYRDIVARANVEPGLPRKSARLSPEP